MANFRGDPPNHGTLKLDFAPGGLRLGMRYQASEVSQRAAGLEADDDGSRLIADLDFANSMLRVFPINTLLGSNDFLNPKYTQIVSVEAPVELDGVEIDDIDVHELFGSLPRGLLRDFQYGLGLPKEYRHILRAIEENTACVNLILSNARPEGVDGDDFVMTLSTFEQLRAELDRITDRASVARNRVKETHVHNSLAGQFGAGLTSVPRGRNAVTQLIADAAGGVVTLNREDQQNLIDAAVAESAKVAASHPATLMKLRGDIELVTLDLLISKFEMALSKQHRESFWQSFFAENPFALSLVFGYSVVQIQGQASVGGKKFSGRGEKVTDFLIKHSVTNNVGIFEIKTPQSSLIKKDPYRTGIHASSNEFSGSISQVLDQRYQLQKSLIAKKDAIRDSSLEQYAIGCCLIIGQLPSNDDELKSFELVRGELKGINVVTYDELLGKLKQLRDFLRPDGTEELEHAADSSGM